jgi:hypothetical protein
MQNRNRNSGVSAATIPVIDNGPRTSRGKSCSTAEKPLKLEGTFNTDSPKKNNAVSSAAVFLGRANATKHATASPIICTIRTNTSTLTLK